MKIQNLSGKKFGKLIVIEKTCKNKWGNWIWKCKCECGNFCEASSGRLIKKEKTHCGCNKRIGNKNPTFIDISGKEYNKLIAIKQEKGSKWRFKCHCGKEFVCFKQNVLRGFTKSCGCKRLNGNIINGVNCSTAQIKLGYILEFLLKTYVLINYRIYNVKKYCADLYIPERNLIVEYDEWYWHGDRLEQTISRNKIYTDLGYKLLIIQASRNLPSNEQLLFAIDQLNIQQKIIIQLKGWGEGIIFNHVTRNHNQINE